MRRALAVAALAIAGTAAFLLARAPALAPTPTPTPTPTPAAASPAPPGAPAPARPAFTPRDPPRLPETGARVEPPGLPAGAEPAGPAVKIGASQQVATVNGTVITGRQLLAWRAGDPAEQEMTPQMFAALRSRAIERELTFTEARRQGLELGPAQLAQLHEVRKNARARGEADPGQLDFEEADARAHLLAAALLEQAGVPAPFATEADVKRYHAAHAGELGELPRDPAAREAAWKQIEIGIRQTLALELQAQHQRHVRAFFDRLRAGVRITV